MIVKRKSILDGKVYEMDLPITPEDLARYDAGEGHVQNIFPNLNADQMEFIMSGITREEWNETFPTEDEEYYF